MNFYKNRFLSDFIWRFILQDPRLRLRLTRLLVKDEDRQIELFGSPLYVNSIKEIGYINAERNNQSNIVARDEVASIINLALLLEPRDTFVDIGANVGLYSSILGRMKHLFPAVVYYAFEANPDTHARLRRTLTGLPIQTECIALSDREGKLAFCAGAVSGAFGSRSTASDPDFQIPDAMVEVAAKRLDQFPLQGQSLILKIDVEGHEWEVLQGAQRFFHEVRIKAVYLDGYKDARIPGFLHDLGFSRFDGRTLENPPKQNFSVLWIHRDWIRRSA